MPLQPTYSLTAKQGIPDTDSLLHLLRRCLFGVSYSDLQFFKNKTYSQCLDVLLKQKAIPEMIAQEDPDITDPLVPNGKQWITAPYEDENIDKRRRIYIKSWWVGQILNRDRSVTEKMVLFWHNHFVTSVDVVKDARYSYQYAVLLRQHAIGNCKQLIKDGTVNPAMLVYLNGNSNNKQAPNENYGRELLELFTLGKTDDVHYTEDDVKATARVLSGWKDDKDKISAGFIPNLHDTDDKKFSAFFDNNVIKGKSGVAGATEKDELLDMVFSKKQTARFICRNLYRWFVQGQVDEVTEEQIIKPLSEILYKNNFEIKPVLHTLLNSEHFFDMAYRGCIVKSPVDFFVGATQQFKVALPANELDCHMCWIHYNYNLGGLSMFIGDPPSVAGWPAFYQPPKYHQWWINSYTLGFRTKILESMCTDEGMNCNGPKIHFDFKGFAIQFKDVNKVDTFIDTCMQLLFAVKISPAIKQHLKPALLNGKTETHWEATWNDALQHDKAESFAPLEKGFTDFFKRIFNMPEFQMI